MEWLDLELSAETSFRLEQQRRELRTCDDPAILRAVAEGLLQQVHHLSAVVHQLVGQVGDLELELAKAGAFPEPDERHLRWAQELLGGDCGS